MMRRFSTLLFLVLLCAAGAWAASLKLVLKDGSYQIVRSYEKQGSRVRFYSLDRDAWEEMPESLVDWKATDEVNKREKEENIEKAREVVRDQSDELKDEKGPEVAPGVFLPDDWGAYAVADGKVVTLAVSKAGTQLDKRRTATNILLPLPVLKNRRLVTLPSAKAALQFDKAPEGIYVTGKAAETSKFAILRVKVKSDKRELEAVLISLLGKTSDENSQIDLIIEELPKQTARLTPREPLPPGEYAIVEFIDEKLNLYVWDFGVRK